MKSFRQLKPHHSVQSSKSSSTNKCKLTLVSQTKKNKLSSAVSYKNSFKEALLCKYEKHENEEQIEALLEGQIKNPAKHKTFSEVTGLTTSKEFKARIKSSCRIQICNNFQNTLWSPASPINKLKQLE